MGPWLATYAHAVAHCSTGVAPEVRTPAGAGVEWDGVFHPDAEVLATLAETARREEPLPNLDCSSGGLTAGDEGSSLATW